MVTITLLFSDLFSRWADPSYCEGAHSSRTRTTEQAQFKTDCANGMAGRLDFTKLGSGEILGVPVKRRDHGEDAASAAASACCGGNRRSFAARSLRSPGSRDHDRSPLSQAPAGMHRQALVGRDTGRRGSLRSAHAVMPTRSPCLHMAASSANSAIL